MIDLYRISHISLWSDLKYGGEFVVFGLALMRHRHGDVGFNIGLMGIRLSVHFNNKAGIERERVHWEETKRKLKEVTGMDLNIDGSE